MDSTCVLIGLQVCFHSAMKHENGASYVVWLPPSCENLQYALRILSFSLLIMKIIISEKNKTCCPCLHNLLKTSAKFVRIHEQVITDQIIDLLSNSPKRLPRFSPGNEGTKNMFYFLKLLKYLSLLVGSISTAHI